MISKQQDKQKIIALIAVGIIYSLILAYFFQSLPRFRLTSDLFPRWYASTMLLDTGRSVYDWTNASEVSAITGWPHLNQLGYYYPAYLLLFTLPLAMMSYNWAYAVWVVFGLWCLWLGTFFLARQIKPDMSLNRLTVLLMLLTTSIPVFQHTLYAQFNSLAVLSLALIYRALYRKRYFTAGLWAAGLLVKPQATLLSLLFLLLWSLFKRERWRFCFGLGFISLILWTAAELLEPNWVISFWQALGNYVPIQSVISILFWNPYQLLTLILLGASVALMFKLSYNSAQEGSFYGLLALTISLNALLVPQFGMLHMVLVAPNLAILLAGYEVHYPHLAGRVWLGTICLFILGLLAFILPLVLTDTSSLQITWAERIYRFTMPFILSLAALPLIFYPKP